MWLGYNVVGVVVVILHAILHDAGKRRLPMGSATALEGPGSGSGGMKRSAVAATIGRRSIGWRSGAGTAA